MVIYETLGGLRSVAWTDAIQGILLLVGCVAIFAAMLWQYDGLTTAADYIIEHKYEIWKPPNAQDNRLWISTILLAFFAISIYPHAIQRIYASKSERTLKRALQFMVFMPFVTTFFMVIVGVISISQFPDLHRLKSDQVSIVMLQDLAQKIPGFQIIVVVFITAVTAAIMSTVDSALLAISSLFTQDLYRNLRPNTSQKHLTNMGKAFSWLFIAFMAYLAITISETIYRLFEIKLEILCQVAPAIFLGLYFKSINSRAIITGILVGLTITLIPLFGFNTSLGLVERPWGIHAGIWGLGFNCLTVFLITLFGPIFNAKKEA
ncbi:MAG: sodium:solute symporter family protein [Bacteroidetes bacterium]|nr:sodium:solute symporter family protein [Bacteroidota bacterium]